MIRAGANLAGWGFAPPPLPVLADHDPGLDRQLHRGEAQGLHRDRFADAVDLEHHTAGLHLADPPVHRAFTLTHANLDRLCRHRNIREDPDPDPALTLHVTRHGTAGRLDLARGDALGLRGLETEGAKVQIRAALGLALDPALELLAEFRALWL